MKAFILLACLFLSSTYAFAATKGKTVTCAVTVDGGGIQDADLPVQSFVLDVENDDVQVGTAKIKMNFVGNVRTFNFVLNTGVAPSLDMSTQMGDTEVTVSGESGAEIVLRGPRFRSGVSCSVQK